ncbi:hypothetical protein [Candidatus Phytoplasma citri]|nr:hypothetical protein [Candidatus Phytoplasma aurantifolia]
MDINNNLKTIKMQEENFRKELKPIRKSSVTLKRTCQPTLQTTSKINIR